MHAPALALLSSPLTGVLVGYRAATGGPLHCHCHVVGPDAGSLEPPAAIIEAADPVTLVRRYTALAAAGKEVVYSDIPQSLLPAFAGLALQMKDAKVRSVVFKTSEKFFSGDPDFDYLRDTVAKAIDPPGTRRKKDDPARPKNTANSCAYDPA